MGKKPLKEEKFIGPDGREYTHVVYNDVVGMGFGIVNRGPVHRDDLVQVEYIPDPSEIIGGRVVLGGTQGCHSRQLDTDQAHYDATHTHTST
jgi:hypothetical protein